MAIGVQLGAGIAGSVYVATGHDLSEVLPHLTQARAAPSLGGVDIPVISGAERARRSAEIRDLLDRRSAALLARDRAGFLAGVDPASPLFRAKQGVLFDNLRQVPLGTWAYTVDANREFPQTSKRLERYHATLWAPQVNMEYRLAGFDDRPTTQQQFLTFVRRTGHWYIGADDDFETVGGQTARGLWDFGPVVVARTRTTLVLGHPRSAEMPHSIASVCDAASPRVTAVWGADWPRKVVVLVPDSQAELSRIAGQGNDLSQIAAVTTADLAGSAAPAGERIIVNPPNFAKLGVLGRRVVLQHEITHVASRAVTSAATPAWLVEGFADYVGYLGTGVAVRTAAHELTVDVRAGRLPTTLPTDADFDGTNAKLPQAYEAAWLANRLIASLLGQRGLVRFYRAVGAFKGAPAAAVDATLRAQLHLSTAQFTVRWRGYVAGQLR